MMHRYLIALVLLVASATLAAGQQPKVIKGQVVPRPAGANLEATLAGLRAQPGPFWVGYSVPVVAGERTMCCFNSYEQYKAVGCCGGCRLETEGGAFFSGKVNACDLEPAKVFFIFVRFEHGQVGRVRSLSTSCAVDIAGVALYWLGEVPADQSVGWLASLAASSAAQEEKRGFGEVVGAIALHDHPSAEAVLQKLASAGQPERAREQAVFWLAIARGRRGFEIVRDLVRKDSDSGFRRHAIFALSESAEPEAQQELIRLAHDDADPEVRSQALFWLAQKAGRKVAGVISHAIRDDPETDVKKKAVFALSQMPDGEGVPLLIEVARNNRNPVVRKEAVFWLGQSNDKRALDFIESLLK